MHQFVVQTRTFSGIIKATTHLYKLLPSHIWRKHLQWLWLVLHVYAAIDAGTVVTGHLVPSWAAAARWLVPPHSPTQSAACWHRSTQRRAAPSLPPSSNLRRRSRAPGAACLAASWTTGTGRRRFLGVPRWLRRPPPPLACGAPCRAP